MEFDIVSGRTHSTVPVATAANRFLLRAVVLILAGAGISLAGLQPAAAGEPARCRASYDVTHLDAPTPRLASTLKVDGPLRIVALGSSSTEGAGASAPARNYPAQLEAALKVRYPGRIIRVLNRGRGGQLAADMLARLDRDVIAEKPALVIWQTGVNDAMRNVDLAKFRDTVEQGLMRLRSAGMDVVLLDLQYFPRAAKLPAYKAYLDAIRDIGKRLAVPVFHRYRLMTYLIETAQYKAEELLAPDQFHLNDLSYSCLAATMAEALHASALSDSAAKAGVVNAGRSAANAAQEAH